jgi:hypothetical protein
VPLALMRSCDHGGIYFDPMDTTFFASRETIVATANRGMPIWRDKLFALMHRNAAPATGFFRIPGNRLGAQVRFTPPALRPDLLRKPWPRAFHLIPAYRRAPLNNKGSSMRQRWALGRSIHAWRGSTVSTKVDTHQEQAEQATFRQIAGICRRRGGSGCGGVSRMDAATEPTWTYLRPPATGPTRHPSNPLRLLLGCCRCFASAGAGRSPAETRTCRIIST